MHEPCHCIELPDVLTIRRRRCCRSRGCYLMQAASGQMAIASKREPIAEVLADSSTPPQLRTRLEYVAAARDFASRELGLPDNESYRSYADLGRPYVVWNVFAAPEFSVEPRRWCFPIAGCVVYRGYFSEEAAQRYARKLAPARRRCRGRRRRGLLDARSFQGSGAEHDARLERRAARRRRCSTSWRTRSSTCRAIRSSTNRSRRWSRRPAWSAGWRRGSATQDLAGVA